MGQHLRRPLVDYLAVLELGRASRHSERRAAHEKWGTGSGQRRRLGLPRGHGLRRRPGLRGRRLRQGRIFQADLGFERDLTRYGFQDFWTTNRTTFTTPTGGEFAISDVGTHEFGHFLGLDHVLDSPQLTMFPLIHNGDDTLGLGDMLGAFLLYH